MKNRLKIYWIAAFPAYPVCTAGAVVIAKDKESAKQLAYDLLYPSEPEFIGYAKTKAIEQVIVSNNGDY